MLRLFSIHYAATMAIALTLSITSRAQSTQEPEMANMMGTVTDISANRVPNATVVLRGPGEKDFRSSVTPENGFFQFHDLKPGVPYHISIRANGFADWTSPTIMLKSGEFRIVTEISLRIPTERATVQVNYDPVQVATTQLKAEENQRVLGIVPNFYVTYESDPAPLTTKMKFSLALKVAADPVTVAGVAFVAGVKQAANSPSYGQGAEGYGKRFGATAADGLTDILIGGAILPSLIHQDPRYFYQGTGTTSSRVRHAMLSPFITRNDNGNWGANYSSVGGVLASSAIANLYYPQSDRGAGVVFGNFAIGTAERIGANLAQEFLLGKLTRRGSPSASGGKR
jgi:carboxypeptidase family protein